MIATADVSTDLVTLSEARRCLIPRRPNGAPVSPSTIQRWISKGVEGIRLRVIYVGATPHTSAEMVKQWCDAVTAKRLSRIRVDEPTVLTASDHELRAAGVL